MPRRLITAAFAGALALAALTGCRFETAADAAFVGDTRYTQTDVDNILNTLKADGVNFTGVDLGQVRQDIVVQSVFRDVAKRYAQEKGYPAPTVDYGGVAQALGGVPTSDPFVRAAAEADAYRMLLMSKVKPVAPTDADYHDAYELLLDQQAVSAGTEAQVKPQLQQAVSQDLGAGVALRNELTAAMKRYNTSVNPKYLPIAYPLVRVDTGTAQPAIVELSLGGSQQAPVRDLVPTVAPSTAEQPAP
jgi:hypothetical protein